MYHIKLQMQFCAFIVSKIVCCNLCLPNCTCFQGCNDVHASSPRKVYLLAWALITNIAVMYNHTPVHVCAVWCLWCFVQSSTCACWCKFLLLVSCANMHCSKMQLLLPPKNSDYSYVHARVLISLTIQRTGSMLSTCAHTCVSVRPD